MKLDVLSDPICPWCYIGKANLDAVLRERPDHPLRIEWHPFQLNPDMPAGGMDRRAYLAATSSVGCSVADVALQEKETASSKKVKQSVFDDELKVDISA